MLDLTSLVRSGYFSKRNDVLRVQEGQYFFRQNDEGEDMYIILSGEVEILFRGDTGTEISLAILKAGSLFGEMTFLENLPRSASARALSNSLVLVINNSNFERLFSKQPMIARYIMGVLSSRLREKNKRSFSEIDKQ